MRTVLMGLVLVMGCGGGSEPPSCAQAVTHYYASGCKLVDAQTGSAFSSGEIISQCQALLANAPASCRDELADLRTCFGSTPTPSTTTAQCDCSPEQDAILTCQ